MRNQNSIFTTLGASNHALEEREQHDYYATDPKAVELLLELEPFAPVIWEPDFLTETLEGFEGDIITNPPYSMGLEFVQKALESVRPGGKVAMFLKVQFLEGQKRGMFFKNTPPRTVYISRSRLACYKNGDMSKTDSAIAYAWYVWEKGFTGDPVIKWFN